MRSRVGLAVPGSSLGVGLDRPWLRIGEEYGVEAEDDGGSGFDSGSESGYGSGPLRPRDILVKKVVKEPLLVVLLVWYVSLGPVVWSSPSTSQVRMTRR